MRFFPRFEYGNTRHAKAKDETSAANEATSEQGQTKRKKSDSKSSFSRRAFLGAAGIAAATAVSAEKASLQQDGIHERLLNVTQLETENARYQIVYSIHNRINNPNVIQGADAVVLEATDITTKKKLLEILKWETEEKTDPIVSFLTAPQYKEIIQAAFANRTPMYFADAVETAGFKREDKIVDFVVPVEELAALGLGLSAAKDLKQTDRRAFITGVAKAAGAAYLSSSIPQIATEMAAGTTFFSEPDESSISRKAERVVGGINEAIHPEQHTEMVTSRNTLIAEKSEIIAKLLRKELGRKPQIAIVIGAAHFGIEDELAASESERIRRLRKEYGENLPKEQTILRIQTHPLQDSSPLGANEFMFDNQRVQFDIETAPLA